MRTKRQFLLFTLLEISFTLECLFLVSCGIRRISQRCVYSASFEIQSDESNEGHRLELPVEEYTVETFYFAS